MILSTLALAAALVSGGDSRLSDVLDRTRLESIYAKAVRDRPVRIKDLQWQAAANFNRAQALEDIAAMKKAKWYFPPLDFRKISVSDYGTCRHVRFKVWLQLGGDIHATVYGEGIEVIIRGYTEEPAKVGWLMELGAPVIVTAIEQSGFSRAYVLEPLPKPGEIRD